MCRRYHWPRKKRAGQPRQSRDGECDDVELEGGQDDVINPYGVTGTDNARRVCVRHKEAPSGDLYAVSSKQMKKSDGDINKNQDDKSPE
ncbi:hypothetical protein LSH36_41g00064 [Paralvinella palmiformis]|uniref:Uncharacterized protein n=1 Tax=Paralvinella palmiformis TaxID=53620 RepID=A0AAD9NF90_9ANNE|nr:hypothetical protein LSH36_41g00064 [Paralvinella palmiformis]